MKPVDLYLHNADQVVTCASREPKRGPEMAEAGVIGHGSVAVKDGRIVAAGPTGQLDGSYTADRVIDCTGRSVCPGLVDAHTHTVFGGDRAAEFELRIKGASYLDIMAAGGGIVSTVRHTRAASVDELVCSATARLDEMLALGTTTVEIKTGYGLSTSDEVKMLQVIERLDRDHPCDIVPTFLGAHAVPPEFEGDAEAYTRCVIDEILPEAAGWYRSSRFAARGVPMYVDVFCEDHAFDLEQSRRVLEAGIDAGFKAKMHVDQFNDMGGVAMALELGAASVDHLDVTGRAEIEMLGGSDTIAVPLPAVNFNLGMTDYADARAMMDSGAAVALATDLNPGSAPCPSMPAVMAIACRYQRFIPAEALNASTINAAHAIGVGDETGSIEVGKRADMLVLKAGDYRHIPYFFGGNPVQTVIKNGQVLSS
ncbi:MAG: imidazolonepropionase [Gemmatimonadetes bacterium]|nr:imidazolonepropionase [Gemmatimonadota bacterium]